MQRIGEKEEDVRENIQEGRSGRRKRKGIVGIVS